MNKMKWPLAAKLITSIVFLTTASLLTLTFMIHIMISSRIENQAIRTNQEINAMNAIFTVAYLESFGADSLSEIFSSGANPTFVTDQDGNILVHPTDESISYDNANTDNANISHTTQVGELFVTTYIPRDVVFEGINATTRRNVYISLIVCLLSILVVWFFTKSLVTPIKEISEACKQIEDGNYNIELTNKKSDETALLCGAVISLSHVLGNFEKLTNKILARLARSGLLETGGHKKRATLFFSDIRSFTAISETMKPNEVVEFLNDYMDRMVACVLLTNGTIDKFIGDAVMAHWGAVEEDGGIEAEKKNAFNGVYCALMMRAALASFNSGRGGIKDPIIKIGCALNSDTVVAGLIGSEERVEFTVIGNAVKRTDRTETFNKPFGTEILITENTYELVGDRLIVEEMPALREGRKHIRVFAVINLKESADQIKIIEDLKKIPRTDIEVCRRFAGSEGPKTLQDVRALIGIADVDLSTVNTAEDEVKYEIKKNNSKKISRAKPKGAKPL